MYKTRKVIFLIIAILAAVFVVLSILNIGSEYTAERLLYKTMSTYDTLPLLPHESYFGKQTFVEDNLRSIITKFPKGNSAKAAYLNLATLYMETKKYDEAISVTDEIMKKYGMDSFISSRAQFIKAVSYEKKGKWKKALEELTTLQHKYPETRFGLQVPFYVVRYYVENKKTAEANKSGEEAIAYYNEVKKEYKGKGFGYLASDLLMQTYITLKRYEEAGRALQNTFANYPVAPQQLPYVELIFVDTLERPETAVTIYKFLLTKTKDAKLKNFLRERIKELEE